MSWLAQHWYRIRRVAHTESREAGKDIVAVAPNGRELWVSAKGYPENSANTQARHWFAGAVFDLVLYRNERADVHLALALPKKSVTYIALAARTIWLQKSMPFSIFWVTESGEVRLEDNSSNEHMGEHS